MKDFQIKATTNLLAQGPLITDHDRRGWPMDVNHVAIIVKYWEGIINCKGEKLSPKVCPCLYYQKYVTKN